MSRSVSPATAHGASNPLLSQAPLVLSTVRCLAADLVQQFDGGHPGTAMGAAAIGLALWGHSMRFNPEVPGWIARDRFVLSAGHACLLQYIYLHLTGYKAWSLEMLRRYHSPHFKGSLAAGHPEVEFEGIEVTTGPLGQGVANAVGLAIAGKHLAAKYNQNDFEAVGQRVWCFSGDGCLQEGVGMEAISLAGHLKLDNLVLIYDDNSVTVDGNIDLTFTDDTCAKLKAQGWAVIDVQEGGTDDVPLLCEVFDKARASASGKPVFIRVKTVIGFGSQNAGLCPTHGAALGSEDVRAVKMAHGQDPEVHFVIPDAVYTAFAQRREALTSEYAKWQRALTDHTTKYPGLMREYSLQFGTGGGLGELAATLLPAKSALPESAIPTRKASGIAVHTLAPALPQIMAGSADLMDSTFVSWPGQVEFQAPESAAAQQAIASGRPAGWEGRQIRYGIREHAMAAIANGLSAYSSSSSALIPVISTFFMFFLYAAPAIRMAALQRLRLIGIATHDSIGIGEDGPTHQPVELAALFRAMPNLNYMRPADAEEVMGSWQLATSDAMSRVPTIISLSRQCVPLLKHSDRNKVLKGAYTVWESGQKEAQKHSLVLVATGSEVSRAVEAATLLSGEGQLSVRVVSMPSQRLFDKQPVAYRMSILPLQQIPVVAVEAYTSYGWARYAHAAVSMHSFGLSGPQEGLYDHFGFAPENIAAKVKDWLSDYHPRGTVPPAGDFRELLITSVPEHGHYF